ncbi:MAG TPA: hypothetical protein VKG44_01765, partial [Candidatus Baltobacteraceae bacterium]|nr:hypothetical protein [Candidatus Baltobacteraceae bacterium]
MSAGFSVRAARSADAAAIARVHIEAWRETYAELMPERARSARSLADREAMWTRALAVQSTTSAFVAAQADEIVGFAACGPVRSEEP